MRVCLKCGKKHAHDGAETCQECGGPVVPIRQSGETLVGRLLADKFLLLSRLGEGGMGSVYRARQENLDRFVAVKVLRLAHADRPEALRRFYAEARNTSRLQHHHNVKIFDFGHTDDGLLFIAMELVGGQPLSRLSLPLEPDRALRIMRQVCSGMAEAHELGLIHRDLKPDNILVSSADGEDFVRILDYGIAKFENSSTGLTEDGRIIGTPAYMSPEQVSSQKLDRRSDIYALGVILYELAVGRPPFVADDSLVVIYKHKNERPPAPSTIKPIPPALERLILDCLAKDPDDRPQSVVELRQRIDELLNGRANVSGPAPTVVGDRVDAGAKTVMADLDEHEGESSGSSTVASQLRVGPGRSTKALIGAGLLVVVAVAVVLLLPREHAVEPGSGEAAISAPATESSSEPAEPVAEVAAEAETVTEGTGQRQHESDAEVSEAVAAAVEIVTTGASDAPADSIEEAPSTADLASEGTGAPATSEVAVQEAEIAADSDSDTALVERDRDDAAASREPEPSERATRRDRRSVEAASDSAEQPPEQIAGEPEPPEPAEPDPLEELRRRTGNLVGP